MWFDTCEPLIVVFIFHEVLVDGCYFPPFLLVLLFNKCWLYNKAFLTTIHGVVLLLQETEPLCLWKMLFLIKDFSADYFVCR